MRERRTDREVIDGAANSFDRNRYDAIEVKCWNEAEAVEYKNYVREKYPELPFRFTWISFYE